MSPPPPPSFESINMYSFLNCHKPCVFKSHSVLRLTLVESCYGPLLFFSSGNFEFFFDRKSHQREISPHFLIIISCCINYPNFMGCFITFSVRLFKFTSQIYWRKITKPYRIDGNIFDRTIHGPKAES